MNFNMTYFRNKSIWFWGFIILIIINLSVLGSMAFVMNRMHNQPDYRAFHHKFKRNSQIKVEKRKSKGIFNDLNLEEDQKKKLGIVHREHTQKVRELKSAIRNNQQHLYEELAKTNPDSLEIQKYRNENQRLHAEIVDESIVFYGKMKEGLSPEQEKVLKNHFLNRMKRSNNRTKK